MKKVIIFAAILFAATTKTTAQNAKVDATGNYVAIVKSKEPGKDTGKFFTDKDEIKFPVFETKVGKLYYVKISKKTGKEYRVFLKL